MINTVKIDELITLVKNAGDAVIDVYNTKFTADFKNDRSPITEADRRSNQILIDGLQKFYPDIPIISEESKNIPYPERQNWKYFWLIDPLDGTKEFIKRNGEFTINIALIHKNEPVIGIIYVPEKRITYYAKQGESSYKVSANGNRNIIRSKEQPDAERLVIVGSRSHASHELHTFVAEKEKEYKYVELVSRGSSLKFCLVAEGLADFYLRTGPTMEWDTAAGHALIIESGKQVYLYNTNEILHYNKEDLRNGWFIVR